MVVNQRQLKKEKTRNEIIESALEIFAKDGLTTARTSDIATHAKVSHGTVFAHFPTREILLETVIEEFGVRITRNLHEMTNSNCELGEVLKAHLIGVSEYEEFYTRLILESRLLNENCRNLMIMIQSAVSFYIDKALEKDIDNNEMRDIPTDLVFNTWIGLVHHYLINSDLFKGEGTFYERNGNRLITHFLNLLEK